MNPKSPLSWASRVILPWPASSLPSGVPGGRTAATVVDQRIQQLACRFRSATTTDQGAAPPTPHQGPAAHEEVMQPLTPHPGLGANEESCRRRHEETRARRLLEGRRGAAGRRHVRPCAHGPARVPAPAVPRVLSPCARLRPA
jgi:hypothetical protein